MLVEWQKCASKSHLFRLLGVLCFVLLLVSTVTRFSLNVEMPDIKKIIDVSNLEHKVLQTLKIKTTISTAETKYQKSSLTTTKIPKVLESKALTPKNIQDIKSSTEVKPEEISKETNKTQILKKILFYTGIFTLDDWGFGFGQEPFERCPVSNCFTTNKQSDGPLISGFHMFLDFSNLFSIY